MNVSPADIKGAATSKLVEWRVDAASIIEAGQILSERKKRLSYRDFQEEVLLKYGIDVNSANKLIKIAKHPIIADPKNIDKIPQSWALLYEAIQVDNAVLQRLIDEGTLKGMNKYQIWAARGMRRGLEWEARARSKNTGNAVYVPPGTTLEQLVRSGMALENKDINPQTAAAKIGIGLSSYRMAKTIIMLTEFPGLSEKDRKAAFDALKEINNTRHVKEAYKRIEPLKMRVWGENITTRLDNDRAQKRVDSFRNAVIIICDACRNGLNIEIPHLPDNVRLEMADHLTEAREAISQLRGKVRRSND